MQNFLEEISHLQTRGGQGAEQEQESGDQGMGLYSNGVKCPMLARVPRGALIDLFVSFAATRWQHTPVLVFGYSLCTWTSPGTGSKVPKLTTLLFLLLFYSTCLSVVLPVGGFLGETPFFFFFFLE